MITKVLIANRGENGRIAGVSPHRHACAAGGGLALRSFAQQEMSA